MYIRQAWRARAGRPTRLPAVIGLGGSVGGEEATERWMLRLLLLLMVLVRLTIGSLGHVVVEFGVAFSRDAARHSAPLISEKQSDAMRTSTSELSASDQLTPSSLLIIMAGSFITARCYASAVLAMGLCPSVCVCVCLSVCHKPVFY